MQTPRVIALYQRFSRSTNGLQQVVTRRPLSSTVRRGADEDRKPPIYVAATRENVGKTTTSLAIMSGLQKRFDKVGFMKPVGQKCVTVQDKDGKDCQVDKDVLVVHDHFHLDHCSFRHMSPVRIPAGYTRDYIDGLICADDQFDSIWSSYQTVDDASDVVLCEGTGHSAVGSIIGASNARVAELLGGKMILVANGGLGSTYDELELNRNLCQTHDVDVAGVIVNRVNHNKYEQTRHYLEKVLQEKHGIPLLGCIPERPFLGSPSLADLERLLTGSQLVATTQEQRLRHYRVHDINLVTTALDCFLQHLRKNQQRSLYLSHSSRIDIMLGFLMEYQRMKEQGGAWEAALVVCGTQKYPIPDYIMEYYKAIDAPPILFCEDEPWATMEQIHNFTPKHNNQDTHRLETAVEHYEKHIDFDLLLERTGNTEGQVAATAAA